jgi:B12 binding domain
VIFIGAMKLALVYPPFYHKAFNENLPTVDDEFGVFPYISYGYVAAEAIAAGWDVRLFDAAADGTGYTFTLSRIQAFGPDLLGFHAHAGQTFQDTVRWARRLKSDTGLPTLVGGYETLFYPHEIMSHLCFDYMCHGGISPFLKEFLTAFERRGSYNNVPGLVYRNNKKLRFNPRSMRLPSMSFPYRHARFSTIVCTGLMSPNERILPLV